MGDITYEPTRDHWTPYQPWMRDVLAADARLSWIDADSDSDPMECRMPWNSLTPVGRARWEDTLRVHPADVPERPAEADPLVEVMRASFRDAYPRTDGDDAVWEYVARAAREHIAQEPDEALWEEWERLCRKAEAERDEWQERAEKAEAAMRDEVAEHDKTRAAVLRLTRERADRAEQTDPTRGEASG